MKRPFGCPDIFCTASLLARYAAISLAEPAWITLGEPAPLTYLGLLQIRLPENRGPLELRRNRSLYSHVRPRLRLEPNNLDNSCDHIVFRLETVSLEGEVFI
jgi:hypothetical protein